MLDFRNLNTLWSSIIAETYYHLGLKNAVLCPGSRSTPLTIAFASHPHIETIPILDERTAAFFALGIAKQTFLPTVLICTSGTAAANFYPAIIEAKESRIPLLILTADRPPELRDCHSGQTIDQVKIYAHYPNWQTELATPTADISLLNYLRQTIVYSWEKTLLPIAGPVHLNIPFRDPLPPLIQPPIQAIESSFDKEEFFRILKDYPQPIINNNHHNLPKITNKNGIIIAGVNQPQNPQEYCQKIAQIAELLKWPVLAEALSPVRNYAQFNPYLITTYDLILRNQNLAQNLTPDIVIQIGDLPTSKQLRDWLQKCQPHHLILDPTYQNLNPLHTPSISLRYTLDELIKNLSVQDIEKYQTTQYLKNWSQAETDTRTNINTTMNNIDWFFEGKISWLLPQILPPKTPLFISNSMPVRDMEFFWAPNNLEIQPYFNRGANGIDGILSTALGIAHRSIPSILLTGDLALLHDTNGFLISRYFQGHLTIILINNNGGGIFEMLPISQFDPPFEEYFATPQHINFQHLCQTYQIEYQLITSWQQLSLQLNPLPTTCIRVLEIQTNRKLDAQWRQKNLSQMTVL